MSEQRPTLAVIAAEAGVSQATVSKVINGRSDVAPSTRERIEALLRSHNYLPPGRQGRARRSGLVDLILGTAPNGSPGPTTPILAAARL